MIITVHAIYKLNLIMTMAVCVNIVKATDERAIILVTKL